MRSGHIRRRAHVRAELREVIGWRVPRIRDLVVGLIEDRVDARVADRRGVPDFVTEAGNRRLIELGVFLVVVAETAFEQQPAGVRARPLGDVHEACWRDLDGRRFWWHRGADAPMIPILPLVVVVDRELVSAARLPGDARRIADDVAVVNAFAIGIGVVDELRRVSIEIAVGDCLLDALMSEGVVEPQFVAEDRPADGGIDVPDALDLGDVGQPIVGIERRAAGQVRACAGLTDTGRLAVVGSPAGVGEVAECLTAERISAVAGHHVHAQPALAHLGGIGAGDVAQFFEAGVVPVDAAELTLRFEIVEA